MSSWFGGTAASSPEAQAAMMDARMTADLFNRIMATCYRKCVPSYREPDLSVGEMSCTDRCVFKFIEGQQVVNEELQKLSPPDEGA
jgi:import inner membrane translocase subunit TIM10